jgi:hypothetical protein
MLSDRERDVFDSLTDDLLRENPKLAVLGNRLDRKQRLRRIRRWRKPFRRLSLRRFRPRGRVHSSSRLVAWAERRWDERIRREQGN